MKWFIICVLYQRSYLSFVSCGHYQVWPLPQPLSSTFHIVVIGHPVSKVCIAIGGWISARREWVQRAGPHRRGRRPIPEGQAVRAGSGAALWARRPRHRGYGGMDQRAEAHQADRRGYSSPQLLREATQWTRCRKSDHLLIIFKSFLWLHDKKLRKSEEKEQQTYPNLT